MKASIFDISNEGLICMVSLKCSVGTIKGQWKDRLLPQIVENCCVELDIEPDIQIGKNATILITQQQTIELKGDSVEICGIVEDLDDDGVGYLRLAVDCLLMFGMIGREIKIGVFLSITIPTSQLGVYCH